MEWIAYDSSKNIEPDKLHILNNGDWGAINTAVLRQRG